MTSDNELTDEELIQRVRDGEDEITDVILNKYKDLVRIKVRKMYILGADEEDLIQEGMIGLFKAIRDFDAGRDVSFSTFATLCISRQIYTAIRLAGRKKHMPLNTYISIYDEDFQKEGGENPLDTMLDRERVEAIEKAIEEDLSPLEKQVLDLRLTGMDDREIAAVLGRDIKSTGNAMSRIKNKLKAFIRRSL
ncbi:MAG: sigma-70 family RNA polymerase sigma factor [Lachnospiraceae bacterium]|nr:sigma-70 family RNA polymerase sigma factor [Lachnospiraceae bacterium]